MPGDFDPYYKWLAIPPEEQPPNHYRLLGVPPFVDDADVIERGAEQRMLLLRNMQAGKHAELTQRLLNEISRASRCLLDAETKAPYDAELRRQQSEASAQSGTATPPDPPPTPPTRLPTPPPRPEGHLNIDLAETEPDEQNLLGKALRFGQRFGAKTKLFARRTSLVAEKRKIESLDLPRSHRQLGIDVAQARRFYHDFVEIYKVVDALEAQQLALESEDDDPYDESLAERARSAARRIKGGVSSRSIASDLDNAYRQLGAIAFDHFGEKSGPPTLTTSIAMYRQRLATIEQQLTALE